MTRNGLTKGKMKNKIDSLNHEHEKQKLKSDLRGIGMDPKHFKIPLNAQIDASRPQARPGMFKEFDATELYCPKCQQAVPVRKRLLLVIPEGDKYEYLCGNCSTSVGTKIDKQETPMGIIR